MMQPNPLWTDKVNQHRTESGVRHVALPSDDVLRVDESYARIEGRLPALTHVFWTRLLASQPSLAARFPPADRDKRDVAATFFRFVVTNLRSTDTLRVLLERMGRRGLLNGVQIVEVDAIGRCLLATLREFEGSSWTVDTAHAWALTITWITTTIRHGASGNSAL